MSHEPNDHTKTTLWWIASIATSVVCCSALFVVFASYLVDVKMGLKDNSLRINIVEEREERILAEVAVIRKRMMPQPSAAGITPVQPAAPASTQTSETPGSTTSPSAPAVVEPTALAPAAPTPTVVVPVAPTPALVPSPAQTAPAALQPTTNVPAVAVPAAPQSIDKK